MLEGRQNHRELSHNVDTILVGVLWIIHDVFPFWS